jgi:molybdenum cofactor sulfurtransferase
VEPKFLRSGWPRRHDAAVSGVALRGELRVRSPRAATAPTESPTAWDPEAVRALRHAEYGRLDANDEVYLDYTGAGLYAESQLRAHHELLRTAVLGNPHSESGTSRAATHLADRARAAILDFVGASPDEYTVVFTANASAALKLVGESFPFVRSGRLLLTADNHNSVNGIRELARARGTAVEYVPLETPSLRVDTHRLLAALDRPSTGGRRLFAYPAQSNYSGVRHPLDWIDAAQERGWDVLLDAAAFIPTNRLDLGHRRPDFVTVSWYKAFGYPTGVGSLIARHEALGRLRRPWFAGGAIGVASVAEPRHTLAAGSTGFEDGTIDFLALPAIETGIRHLEAVGMNVLHDRVRHLTRRLLRGMGELRHPDGEPMVRVYGPADSADRGGTVPFNLLETDGAIVDFPIVDAFAASRRVSLRSGCFCNPGASETARGITADEMRQVFALGHQPSVAELRTIMGSKALGALRASVGIATTDEDVDRLFETIRAFFDQARRPVSSARRNSTVRENASSAASLR